jgi:hypothetical protein
MDLASPGFSLYFPKGIDLNVGSTGAPFLSWSEGSVAQTVSTPAEAWILVSFRRGEPPILFVFPDAPQSMIVDGEPGNWHLRTIGAFSGWARVILPLGLDSVSPVTASALGDLAQRIKTNEELWVGAAPKLVDTKVDSDPSSVTVTWTYDRAGAVVPSAALLAGYGGYPLHVTTDIQQLESSSEEGPMAVTKEPRLSIRFLIKQWPACRYMATGDSPSAPAPGPLDIGGLVNLAFDALDASADKEISSMAGTSLMSYLSSAHGELEPFTSQHLPYAATGQGYDTAAANALLTQALADAGGTPELQNPLLTEVQARVDWYTWQPWNIDEPVWRRGAALAAITLAMRQEPQQRLAAAMLQAGLSSQRGLDLWRYWRGDLLRLPPHLEVMENLRRQIFSLQGQSQADDSVTQIFSPVRYCGPGALSVQSIENDYVLNWLAIDASPGTLQLDSAYKLHFFKAQNIQTMDVDHTGTTYKINFTPVVSGPCVVELSPADAPRIPAKAGPVYAETSH